MKNTRTLIAALVITTAALAGCGVEDTTKDEAAQAHAEGLSEVHQVKQAHEDNAAHEDSTESPQPEPSPSFPGGVPSFENDWAKEKLEQYMIYQGANSLKGFSQGSPERNIVAVTNPQDGVIRFEVRDLDYDANGWLLDGMAMNFMSYTGCAADDVEGVIIETTNEAESVSRDQCG